MLLTLSGGVAHLERGCCSASSHVGAIRPLAAAFPIDNVSRSSHIIPYMANETEYDTKLSAEGRVVIPAEVRRVLGVGPGGQVIFVVDGQKVHVVTPRLLIEQVWANNEGGDGGDSAADVRALRDQDSRAIDARWEQIEAEAQTDMRSDEDVIADLLSGLGLTS